MILFQILDEGSITDSQGRQVDFKNMIICNLGETTLLVPYLFVYQHPLLFLGSDILSHPSSGTPKGIVTADAKSQILERTSE